jgi:tRNA(Ile)-lysidine synthase
LIAIERSFAAAADSDAAIYALRILLAVAGGSEHLPDRTRAATLFGRLPSGSFRATLSRAVIDARRDAIFVRRENRGLPGEGEAGAGDIWDGRYRLGGLPDNTAIAALGLAHASALLASEQEEQSAAAVPASLRRAALAVEPALWRGGQCRGLACEAGAARRIIAPWARFLPSFDLEPARAVAALLGADIPPEPPLPGHKERKG